MKDVYAIVCAALLATTMTFPIVVAHQENEESCESDQYLTVTVKGTSDNEDPSGVFRCGGAEAACLENDQDGCSGNSYRTTSDSSTGDCVGSTSAEHIHCSTTDEGGGLPSAPNPCNQEALDTARELLPVDDLQLPSPPTSCVG